MDQYADSFSLSPMQQTMLFQSVTAPRPGVDIEQIILTFPVAPDRTEIEAAWRRAARRHPALRAEFRWRDRSQPRQRFAATVEPEFAFHDWSDRPAGDQLVQWEDLLAADRRRGFRLEAAPLWRIHIVRTGDSEHRLLFSFHHLLLDGRGLVVLLEDVYAADRDDAGAFPAPTQRDVATWLETRGWDEARDFWTHTLRGFTSPTPLPGEVVPTEAEETPAAAHEVLAIELSPERTRALRDLGRRHALTLNTFVQAAWALLLGRYAGSDNVVIGAVRACRHSSVPAADRVVGLLINTLPLRVPLPPEQTVHDWLRAVRASWVELRPHEHTPLAELRRWSDVPPELPLFRSVVNFQEPGWDDALRALGGQWRRLGYDVRSQPAVPLAVDAVGGVRLSLRILHDPTRFDPAFIRQLLDQFAALLAGMAARFDRPLAELSHLPAAERRHLLTDWNHTTADFPDDLCVHHLFAQQAARTPEALAVADGSRRLSYAGLDRESITLARRLHRLGVGPGDCVGVCIDRSVDLVVALLAVLRAGAAYLPLDPASPPARLRGVLADSGARRVVTTRRFDGALSGDGLRPVLLDQPDDDPAPVSPEPAPALPSAQDLAYVIYTSGSTGAPKGVEITHRSLVNLVTWHQREYQLTPSDRTTQVACPAFDAATWEIWSALTAGASLHVPTDEVRSDPVALLRWFADRGITVSFVPTPLAEAVLDGPWPRELRLRALLTGGDRLRRRPGSGFPCALYNHYGPTECTVVATAVRVRPGTPSDPPPSIGTPIANTQAYVLDATGQPAPVGARGELFLGGAGLARGYRGQEGLTEQKFIRRTLPGATGDRLYRTGDLVRWLPCGQLEFLGRLDDQIKVRGHRIEPAEIESRLNEHPAVRESLVLAREDAHGQPQLVAYFVGRAGVPEAAPGVLAEHLRGSLPSGLIPAAFVRLAEWPLTPHGKVNRPALPSPLPAVRHDQPPRTETERVVARVWEEVLGVPRLGANDDFFALGGHSLRAAQVATRLSDQFGISLGVRRLFQHPTVAALAAEIDRRREASRRAVAPPALVPVSRRAYRAPAALARSPVAASSS